MTPEFSRLVPLGRIGANGLTVEVEASPEECAALAQRMQLPEVHALRCSFVLHRIGDTVVSAAGTLTARVVQVCVVSLEEFETTVTETFQVRFVPADEVSEEVDPDSDDEIPYEGLAPDLGEAAAEQLGLALDPYPRMPGAELPDAATDDSGHPFAALAALSTREPD